MANNRTPLAKAKVTGTDQRNPSRFKDRKEPRGQIPLGAPSDFLAEDQKGVFEGFKRELPWLMESDRAVVEMATVLRSRMLSNPEGVGVSALQALGSTLSKLGATPSDRTKVSLPDDEEEEDEFFDN